MTAFLEPVGDLCWAFCLSYLPLVVFPSFWLGCTIPVLVLVGCCCLAMARCEAQRALGDHKGISPVGTSCITMAFKYVRV